MNFKTIVIFIKLLTNVVLLRTFGKFLMSNDVIPSRKGGFSVNTGLARNPSHILRGINLQH